MLLMFGPLAQWFVTADRVLFDVLAAGRPSQGLNNAYIVSIDPQRKSQEQVLAEYGKVLEKLQAGNIDRIILSRPPEIPRSLGREKSG